MKRIIILFLVLSSQFFFSQQPGTLKWEYQTGGNIESSPAIEVGSILCMNNIIIGSTDNYVYVINREGNKVDKYNLSAETYSSPAISGYGSFYIGSNDYNIYRRYKSEEHDINYMLPFFTTGNIIQSTAAVDSNGIIYVGSWDKKFYAIEPPDAGIFTGIKKWEFQMGSGMSGSAAIADDGTIYFGSWDEKIYALNPDGTKKWEFLTGASIKSSPAIDSDGTIYIGSNDKKLYAINPNGTKKWEFLTGGIVRSSPAIDNNGIIYDMPPYVVPDLMLVP